MAKILITGGAGFIGSHLLRALLDRGDEVCVLDDLSSGRRSNLEGLSGSLEFIEGSLLDAPLLERALEGVNGVLHQAAMPSVPKSIAQPLATHEANVTGTLRLLEACRHGGKPRVVFAGSSSAYGDHQEFKKSEELEPRPLSPYALQKLSSEYYCHLYHDLFGLETVVLRYFNVFGPRQDPNSQYSAVIPLFITRALQGLPLTIHGDGLQSRDFTYVQNVVDANLAALDLGSNICGRVYNVACGDSITLLDVIDMLEDAIGVKVQRSFVDSREGDIRHSCANISRIESEFDWSPNISMKVGMEKTIAYYAKLNKSKKG